MPLFLPTSDKDIEVRDQGMVRAVDRQSGTGIGGTRSGGAIGDRFKWVIRSAKGNYDTILNVEGLLSEGYRRDVGATRAFTVTRAYPDTYFPYRDASITRTFGRVPGRGVGRDGSGTARPRAHP